MLNHRGEVIRTVPLETPDTDGDMTNYVVQVEISGRAMRSLRKLMGSTWSMSEALDLALINQANRESR